MKENIFSLNNKSHTWYLLNEILITNVLKTLVGILNFLSCLYLTVLTHVYVIIETPDVNTTNIGLCLKAYTCSNYEALIVASISRPTQKNLGLNKNNFCYEVTHQTVDGVRIPVVGLSRTHTHGPL